MQCVEGGLISPTNCIYMGEWLNDRTAGGSLSEEHSGAPSRRGSMDDPTLAGRKRRASSSGAAESLAW